MGYSKVARDISVKLGPVLAPVFHCLLRRMVFVVGFNKSAKSTIVHNCLVPQSRLSVFPGEGNDVLWFRGFYPWADMNLNIAPVWHDPERFIHEVLVSRKDGFREARSVLSIYQIIRAPTNFLLNDSGMLAALLPDVMPVFPGAKVIHIVRDGRVVSSVAAKITFAMIKKNPEKYRSVGCPLNFYDIAEAKARYWCWTLDRIRQIEESYPRKVLQVRYEDWCVKPEVTLIEIMNFIGLRNPPVMAWQKEEFQNLNEKELSDIPRELLYRIEKIQTSHLKRLGYKD